MMILYIYREFKKIGACAVTRVKLEKFDELRSGVVYHNNYVAKESGDKVKEAYFPLENVPGKF